jgi:AraC-like DNA-binding protein
VAPVQAQVKARGIGASNGSRKPKDLDGRNSSQRLAAPQARTPLPTLAVDAAPTLPDLRSVHTFDETALFSLRTRISEIADHQAFEYFRPLKRLKILIENSYSEPISLPKAAKVAGLERKYLSTYFRKKVGTTFSVWLVLFRIREALALIETQDLSITEVALSVGLEVRTFERWFKKLVGYTPREYRNSVLIKAGFLPDPASGNGLDRSISSLNWRNASKRFDRADS